MNLNFVIFVMLIDILFCLYDEVFVIIFIDVNISGIVVVYSDVVVDEDVDCCLVYVIQVVIVMVIDVNIDVEVDVMVMVIVVDVVLDFFKLWLVNIFSEKEGGDVNLVLC